MHSSLSLNYQDTTIQATLSSSPTTVLVVEDEQFVRNATYEILNSCGYQVWKAADATEALDVFRRCKGKLGLLITDLALPGQSGLELVRHLRTLQPMLKTILMSGYPEKMVSINTIQENTIHYIAKPFSVDLLLRKVRQVLAVDGAMPEAVTRASCIARRGGSGLEFE